MLHSAGHALSLLSVASRSAEAAAALWQEAENTVTREVLSKLEKLRADFGEGDATAMEDEGGRIGLGGTVGGSGGGKEDSASAPSAFPSSVACLSKAALCGAVSAPLAHFWESDPGPRGLRAAARSSDEACRSASEIVRATTEPALEAACYFVGELQRVAESSSGGGGEGSRRRWGGALGLEPREAAEAARRARDASAAAAAARAAVAEGVASSRALFLWLMASAARATTTAAGVGGEGEDDEGGGAAPADEAERAAAARAAARTTSAVLPRGDPLAATRALSGSVAVNPRLAAAVALGRGGGGGPSAGGEEGGEAGGGGVEARARASCDPLSHPGIPAAVLDALGRRSWPPAGKGTMRSLALAASSAVEGLLVAVRERLSAEMAPAVEGSAGRALALGRAERRAQVCLVAGSDGSSPAVRVAAAFIAPGGSAAVAARAVAVAGSGSGSGTRPVLAVEVAAVAPVVGSGGGAGEGGGRRGDSPVPRVVGVGLYRGHALALLSDGGEGAATLALVTADELPFSSPSSKNVDAVEKEKSFAARCRLVSSSSSSSSSDASAAPPLAVSASRGVACALTAGGLRATVFDLEDDDDEEEEEEGGVGEEDEGGAKSSDDEGNGHRRHRQHHDSDDSSSLSDGSSGGGMSSE